MKRKIIALIGAAAVASCFPFTAIAARKAPPADKQQRCDTLAQTAMNLRLRSGYFDVFATKQTDTMALYAAKSAAVAGSCRNSSLLTTLDLETEIQSYRAAESLSAFHGINRSLCLAYSHYLERNLGGKSQSEVCAVKDKPALWANTFGLLRQIDALTTTPTELSAWNEWQRSVLRQASQKVCEAVADIYQETSVLNPPSQTDDTGLASFGDQCQTSPQEATETMLVQMRLRALKKDPRQP